MKTSKNNCGLTLTELIVSVILMGIVMLGIASFNYGIKSVQDSTNRSSLLAMRAQAGMHEIVKAARLATGTSSSQGIWCRPPAGGPISCGTSSGGVPYFSFRQDINNTPDDPNDDQWVIFTSGDLGGAFQQMYSCTQTNAQGFVPLSTGNCSSTGKIFLYNNISGISYDFSPNTNGLFFDIDIKTRYDPTKALDPMTNPEYEVHTRIIPSLHSW